MRADALKALFQIPLRNFRRTDLFFGIDDWKTCIALNSEAAFCQLLAQDPCQRIDFCATQSRNSNLHRSKPPPGPGGARLAARSLGGHRLPGMAR